MISKMVGTSKFIFTEFISLVIFTLMLKTWADLCTIWVRLVFIKALCSLWLLWSDPAERTKRNRERSSVLYCRFGSEHSPCSGFKAVLPFST